MKVLFVSYGGGHIEMCLPVMRALRAQSPGAELTLMALTTAHDAARRAGEMPLGYRDFAAGPLTLPDAARALHFGQQLMDGHWHPVVAEAESCAYLGFNFLEWVQAHGEATAWQRWYEQGRFGFQPVQFFQQVLQRLQPDVVVSTNSPRSEQAVVEAAAALSIPSLSMVDLFALPGDAYLARKVHASRITVLAEATRDNLVAAGVAPERIVVTGNPAFDALLTPQARAEGQAWQAARGWEGRHVVLWAGHKEADTAEPAAWAGTRLGQAVQQRLVDWVLSRDDLCLVMRYHPNEWHEFTAPAAHPRLHWSQPSTEGLPTVLLGADQVVVQATTVGAQAHAAGKRVVSLAFSPLVRRTGMDYARLGLAYGIGSLEALVPALEQGLGAGPEPVRHRLPQVPAAPAVAQLIIELAQEPNHD